MLMTVFVAGCSLVMIATMVILSRWLRQTSVAAPNRALAIFCAVCIGLSVFLCLAWAARTRLMSTVSARSLADPGELALRGDLSAAESEAVLTAAREVLADTNSYQPPLVIARLPGALRDLNPQAVSLAGNRAWLRLELGSASLPVSLTAFRPGERGFGTRELIPGLWYGLVPARPGGV
jgi:hypothetical protein